MSITHDFTITNPQGLAVRGNVHVPEGDGPFPVMVACHGFKGFKDWGWYPSTGDYFAERGIVFLRFNFSLNGVEEDFLNFTNLENFAKNTVSQEVTDLNAVIDALVASEIPATDSMDLSKLVLWGHSRGGGVSIIHAAQDARIKGVLVMASISSFSRTWAKDMMAHWKEEGVIYIPNARTKQSMPLNYSLCEDIMKNQDRFDILKRVADLRCPFQILHGEEDVSVDISEGEAIASAAGVELIRIENAQHTFNIKHPFAGFSPEFLTLLGISESFLRSI